MCDPVTQAAPGLRGARVRAWAARAAAQRRRGESSTVHALEFLLTTLAVPSVGLAVPLSINRPDGWPLEAGLAAVAAFGFAVIMVYVLLVPTE